MKLILAAILSCAVMASGWDASYSPHIHARHPRFDSCRCRMAWKDTTFKVETSGNRDARRNSFDTVYGRVARCGNGRFVVDGIMRYGDYEIEVRSDLLHDSESEVASLLFNPIRLRQKILFYHRKQLQSSSIYPVRRIVHRTAGGERVRMQENVIQGVGIVRGKRNDIVVIMGYGECSDCSEFWAYYTLRGKLLYLNYRTKWHVYRQFGDVDRVIRDYGLDERGLGPGHFSWVRFE